MQRRAVWLWAVAGILVLGCSHSEPPAAEQPTKAAAGQPQESLAARPQAATNRALVQVVIHGLAALELERDATNKKLTGINAHFPEVGNPDKHDLQLDRGVKTTKHQWQAVKRDDNNLAISLPGKTITVNMNGDLEAARSNNLGKYPANRTEAADAGWLLLATEIDGPTAFNPGAGSLHVKLAHGTLETCALVFPKKAWGSEDKVCKVKTENQNMVDRSLSEIMVVRGWVPKVNNTASVVVEIKGQQTQKVTIPPTKGDSVTWNDVTYDTVIDIAIGNRSDHPDREMQTTHGNHLKNFFSGASLSWDMKSYDCTSAQNCGCKAAVQPECWKYIFKLFDGSVSGYDRPICPLIGWDQP